MNANRHSSVKRWSRRLRPHREVLEPRCLLSAQLGTDGTLTVQGQPTADVITLTRDNDEAIRVVENGAPPARFPLDSVRAIIVRGAAGDDAITIGPGLVGAILDGGPGQDTLTGGDGDDWFQSRDGEADVILGGLGVDRVWSDSPDTVSGVEVVNPMPETPDNQTQVVKVLVLSWDPLVPSEGNRPLHEVFNWMSPAGIAARYRESMERNAGEAIRFDVVEWRNINEIPVFEDGFQYTPEQYVQNRRTKTGWHLNVPADFRRIVEEQGIVSLINSGTVDEVWCIGDHYFALPGESWMAGPEAFFINGPVYADIPTIRPFACMGFSYERPDTLTHNMGHRTEATLNRIYGGWNLQNPVTNWDNFSANYLDSNGVPGIGTAHVPANGDSHYDYANTRTVLSTADDWLNYPNLTGATTPITRTAWSKEGREYQWEYFEWYYNHLPRASGVNADGKQNNWWKYLYNFENYTQDGQPRLLRASALAPDLFNLGGTSYQFQVAYSGATFIDRQSLDNADVLVSGPNGYSQQARLVSINNNDDGPYLVGTYEIAAPGGTWDSGDRGVYSLTLMPDAVRDVTGLAVPTGVLGAFRARSAAASALDVSPGTTLLLPFDQTTSGANGETPSAVSGITYTTGRVGQAVRVDSTSALRYPTAGNIAPGSGTIEFWFRPDWTSGTVEPGVLFQVGPTWNNGLLIQIDGALNVRFQQWGDDPATPGVESNAERGIGTSASRWQAGQWHHLAATWNDQAGELAFYVDGVRIGVEPDAVHISSFATTDLSLGTGTAGDQHALGAFDELRILDHALSASVIAADARAGIGYQDLALELPAAGVNLGDTVPLRASSTTGAAAPADVSRLAAWTSSNPTILAIQPAGTAQAVGSGSVTLTARLDTLVATRTITVGNPGRPGAMLAAPAVHTTTRDPYQFDVTYTDSTAVRATTIDGNDVQVIGPAGFHAFAELVTLDTPGDGPTRRATYRITPPGGLWRPENNGAYTIELTGFQVGDTTGQWAAPAVLGQFTVAIPVTVANRDPQIAPIPDQVVQEGRSWSLDVAATDPDPGQTLRFALAPGVPAGMTINANTGRLTWSDPDGPAAVNVTVLVADDGTPARSASRSFLVTVHNLAPTALLSGNGPVAEGSAGLVLFSSQADASPSDTTAGFTYSYDLDDDGVFEIANSTSPSAVVPAHLLGDGPGSRTLHARIRDKDGSFTDYTTILAVTNMRQHWPRCRQRSGSARGQPCR